MLVLSRKKNESIIINDDIIITVVEIRGDKVRLGIQAPASVSVHRRKFTRRSTDTPRKLPLPRTKIVPSRLNKASLPLRPCRLRCTVALLVPAELLFACQLIGFVASCG
jgi:carbon storage regulator